MYEATKRNKSRIIYDCGGWYQQQKKHIHEKTKKHLNYIPAGNKLPPPVPP